MVYSSLVSSVMNDIPEAILVGVMRDSEVGMCFLP